jgi:hypothetical protein
VLGALVLVACGGPSSEAVLASEVLTGADEEATLSDGLNTSLPVGSSLVTTANLNLRAGPSTAYDVRLVIPKGGVVTTINRSTPAGSWYNVSYNGTAGWVHGGYVTVIDAGPGATPPTGSGRAGAIARAKSGVGFSYYWGHGSWIPNGATSSTVGACTGNCPQCTHSGRYGADCSGFAAKVWQVPASNDDATVDSHPYSTYDFNGSNSQWRTISRSSAQPGDALVYNDGSAGHIAIYESGDAWGSTWSYEARGCAYGIVHNLRSFGSAYKAIARTGY